LGRKIVARYIADPNNDKKVIPAALNVSAHGRAETPVATVINHRPNHVVINETGSYAFCYESTSSLQNVNGTLNTYITGSVVLNANALPVRLDINPVAWRDTVGVGSVGHVTFVYTGNVG
jgi:hypothetical protein